MAFGGGVLSDLVTVAASWIRRGIRHVRIPTTLLAQIDAGIGVKGAFNFSARKGFLGCFYSPAAVFLCPSYLASLPARQIRCGIAEMVKMAIVADHHLFEQLETHGASLSTNAFQTIDDLGESLICIAVRRMLDALRGNLFEDQSYERAVDFGHTFSPLIEARSQFSIAHGEAVAIDMAVSTLLAKHASWLSGSVADRILTTLENVGLPIYSRTLTLDLCRRSLEEAAQHRGGRANLVVPAELGTPRFVSSVSDELFEAVLKELSARSRQTLSTAEDTSSAISALQSTESKAAPTTWGVSPTMHETGDVSPPNSEGPVLVMDIGGTSTRSALYDAESDRVFNRASCPTPNHLLHPNVPLDELIRLLKHAIENVAASTLKGRTPNHVAMAFAGPINAQGHVFAAPTVWGQALARPIDLRLMLQEIWSIERITVINDVTAAGYRFLRHANDDLVAITVGSGIGNKTFLDGRPRTGPNGRGGEIGHIQVDSSADAPICECGGRGHLGGIASGRGTLRIMKRAAQAAPDDFRKSLLGRYVGGRPNQIDNEQIVRAFHSGDDWTQSVVQTTVTPFAQVLATIHLNLGIERFVIYGGFGLAMGEPYRKMLVAAAKDACWNVGHDWNEMIHLGSTDDDSGLVGAGRAAVMSEALTGERRWISDTNE